MWSSSRGHGLAGCDACLADDGATEILGDSRRYQELRLRRPGRLRQVCDRRFVENVRKQQRIIYVAHDR